MTGNLFLPIPLRALLNAVVGLPRLCWYFVALIFSGIVFFIVPWFRLHICWECSSQKPIIPRIKSPGYKTLLSHALYFPNSIFPHAISRFMNHGRLCFIILHEIRISTETEFDNEYGSEWKAESSGLLRRRRGKRFQCSKGVLDSQPAPLSAEP